MNGKNVKTQSYNSGGWDKVGKKTLDITLEPGNNVIRLSNTSSWMPDIDYIDVMPVEQTSVDEVKATTAKDEQLYDLQGRKIKAGQAHGIVISNHRKKITR